MVDLGGGGNSFQFFSYFGVWHFGIDLKYFGPKIEYFSRNFKLFSHNLKNFGQNLDIFGQYLLCFAPKLENFGSNLKRNTRHYKRYVYTRHFKAVKSTRTPKKRVFRVDFHGEGTHKFTPSEYFKSSMECSNYPLLSGHNFLKISIFWPDIEG